MNRTPRRVTILAVAAALAMIAALPATSAPTTVVLADVAGSRMLTVTDTSGTSLDGASVAMAPGASVPFVANVTDLLYENVGYTVDASMSNLYLVDTVVDGTPGYDCSTYVPSADLGISWPAGVLLGNIEALVTDVLFDVTGTLTTSNNGTLDGILTTVLGGSIGNSISGTDLTSSGQGLVETILSGVGDGSLLDLPLTVANGGGGDFAAPAGHSTCGGAAGATSVNLQSGTPNNAFSLDAIATTLDGTLTDTSDVIVNGYLSESQILEGVFGADNLAEIQTLAGLAGLSGTLDTYLSTIANGLTVADVSIGTLARQTGTYTSLPSLDAAPTLNVEGDAPTGVNAYEGEMLVTVSDVP